MLMLLMFLLIDSLLLLLLLVLKGSVDRSINLELRGSVIDRRLIIPLFRFCSFAAAAAIGLSSIANADAVAADRSTTVVAAITAMDPPAEHENYDESAIDQ